MIGNMGESSIAMSAHFHVNIALANAVHGDADLPWRADALSTTSPRASGRRSSTACRGSTSRMARAWAWS